MTENIPPSEGPQQQQPPAPSQPPPGEGAPGEAPPPAGGEVPSEARTFGMLCHLLALAGFVVPFGNVIGPLVIWLIKKDEHPFVDDQGKEALNWQITLMIGYAISIPLMFVCVGIVTAVAIAILALVYAIIGGLKANRGERFRYPWSIKFVK